MGWISHLCLMNMKRRKTRTFLTILGVVIGVISDSGDRSNRRQAQRPDDHGSDRENFSGA